MAKTKVRKLVAKRAPETDAATYGPGTAGGAVTLRSEALSEMSFAARSGDIAPEVSVVIERPLTGLAGNDPSLVSIALIEEGPDAEGRWDMEDVPPHDVVSFVVALVRAADDAARAGVLQELTDGEKATLTKLRNTVCMSADELERPRLTA